MPLSPKEVKELEELEALTSEGLDPNSDDYETTVRELDSYASLLDEHYRSLRKVDDNGKLTEDAKTRLPAVVEGDPNSTSYFFEPNAREVQTFFRKNPNALDSMGLRGWAEGIAQEEIRTPNYDPQTQTLVGYNIQPAKTNLDMLQESDDVEHPYTRAANEMFRLRSEEAQSRGETLKRYRDIKLNRNEIGDWLRGGVEKGMQRVVAPALMGAADAFTAGQASPLGDALTDLADYTLARTKVDFGDPYGIGDQGLELESIAGAQPRSEEVTDRNLPAYVAGNFAAYGAPRNPTNALSRGLTEVALEPSVAAGGRGFRALTSPIQQLDNYAASNLPGRAVASGVSGAVGNVVEGGLGDMARYANEGDSIPVGLAKTGMNVPLNFTTGFAGGMGFDLLGQGVGAGREIFRDLGRNAPLRTLEQAGGEASIPLGVSPTPEIRQAYADAKSSGMDPTKAPVTAAGKLAGDLAPHLDQSIRRRAAASQEQTAREMEEYYAHPDYNTITASTRPAVEGLLDMATRQTRRRGSVDGTIMPMDPAIVDEIGGVLRDYSQFNSVPRADGPSVAHQTGGVLVEDGELVNRLYGLAPDDARAIRPGRSAIIYPIDINAQDLTALEGRIDRELQFSRNKGAKDDPVWNRFNERVKAIRDQFPAYKDAEGNLVPPPPDSAKTEPFPLDPGAAPQQGSMHVLSPPLEIKSDAPVKPEGLMGVGPGGPPIPDNPFDPRLPVSRETINPQRTIQVQGDYSDPGYIGPEAIPGIGPNYQPPNDPRRLGPPVPVQGQFDMGGEYSQPPMVAQPDRMGIGRGLDPRERLGQPIDPQQQASVQGSFSEPPTILPGADVAPATNRNPYGFANQVAEESLSTLAGNKLAMKAPEGFRIMVIENGQPRPVAGMRTVSTAEEAAAMVDTLNSYGTDEFVAEPIAPQLQGQRGQVSPDKRGGLERMLDDQLERAPKVPSEEIAQDAALQTADREQVAADQRDYVEKLFAPGREARAAQVEKARALGEHPEVIEEAIEAVKKVDERLGPIPQEQKRQMVVDMIEKKLGRKIDAEDLIRFGLISAGLVQASTGEDDGVAVGLGAAAVGLGGPRMFKSKNINEVVERVSRITSDAVKRLTPDERRAISEWSSSSHQTKEAFERVGRTPEENEAKLRELGYSEKSIQRFKNEPASESDLKMVKDLEGAMNKLAIHNPTDYGPLYRGFAAGDTTYGMPTIEELRSNGTFINKTPISTSYNATGSHDFARGAFIHKNQTPVLIEFRTVNRAAPRVHPDLQVLGGDARMREAEVIIPPGSTFKVVERKTQKLYQYPEGHKFHSPKDALDADVYVVEQVADAPREAWKDAAMIAAALGIGEATDQEEAAGLGAMVVAGGRGGKKGKPTQPTATLDDGRVVRGFSAMRNQQHTRQEAIERAMRRLGVEGDATLEGRIRTYGQLNDRGKIDQALLDEAIAAGKERELRSAAGANAYESLKDTATVPWGGTEGIAKGLLDFFGLRGYRLGEYFSGRHLRNTPRGDDGLFRNPYVRGPNTFLGEIQRTMLEDPARRLLDLTGGSASARWADDAYRLYEGDERYEEEKRPQ